MKQWTLQALAIEWRKDLSLCESSFETSNVTGIYRKDIKQHAREIIKSRKLNPAELAILEDFSIIPATL